MDDYPRLPLGTRALSDGPKVNHAGFTTDTSPVRSGSPIDDVRVTTLIYRPGGWPLASDGNPVAYVEHEDLP